MKLVLALGFQGCFTGERSRWSEVTLVLLAPIFVGCSTYSLVSNHFTDCFMRGGIFSNLPLEYELEIGPRINTHPIDLSLMNKTLLESVSFSYEGAIATAPEKGCPRNFPAVNRKLVGSRRFLTTRPR